MPRPARRPSRKTAPKGIGRPVLRRRKVRRGDLLDIPMVASMVRAMTAPAPGNTPMSRAMPIPGRIALAAGNYLIGKAPAPAVKRQTRRAAPKRPTFVPTVRLDSSKVRDLRPSSKSAAGRTIKKAPKRPAEGASGRTRRRTSTATRRSSYRGR